MSGPDAPSDGGVLVERRPDSLWITLRAPDRLNAFTADGYRAVRRGLEVAAADPAVAAVVLTGTERAFSAGADRALVDGTAGSAERARAGAEFEALFATFAACDVPVVAAVNGLAVGVGATILLHCDLVVLAASARIRLPFTALGLSPEAGSSVLLPARARWSDAVWAMLSSEWLDAEQALAMGLAWRVVPDDSLTTDVDAVVGALAANDPRAVRATKRLLVAGRADAVRAAMDRELAAMAELTGRRAGPPDDPDRQP